MRRPRPSREAEAESGEAGEDGEAGEATSELEREAMAELPMLAGTDPDEWDSLCVRSKRPESLKELSTMFGGRAISRLAPYGSYAQGAALNAVAQRAAMKRGSVAGTAGKARLYGKGPLIVNDPAYPEVNGLGLADNSGRIDSYAWDQKKHAPLRRGRQRRHLALRRPGEALDQRERQPPDHRHRRRLLDQGPARHVARTHR